MLALIGDISLIVILALSTLLTLGAIPTRKFAPLGETGFTRFVSTSITLSAFIALGSLIIAHAISDFSLVNVIEYSHTSKPLLYKITGSWGNHEGSMLLLLTILTLYGSAFAWAGPRAFQLHTLASYGLVTGLITLFILLTSNPFITVDIAPPNGFGLNPLLQDVGLSIHPPLLYAGYMGFIIPFGYAIAVLITQPKESPWPRSMKNWTLIAWSFLTAGIALGSWWAYRELGWGGFWFWDPVENASLMPWLLATALIHSLIMSQSRNGYVKLSLLLALLTFGLSLLGTFLVRSGVLTSVHAFATSPERGLFILGLITIIMVLGLTLFARFAPRMESSYKAKFFSRETFLSIQLVLLVTACITVVWGTLFPIFYEAFTSKTVAVGSPFFDISFTPIAALTAIFAGIGPMVAWKQQAMLPWLKKSAPPMLSAILATIALIYLMEPTNIWLGILLGCGWWLVFASLWAFSERVRGRPLTRWPKTILSQKPSFLAMVLAHASIGLLLIALTSHAAWQHEYFGYIEKGEALTLNNYSVTLTNIEYKPYSNYLSQQGDFILKQGDNILGSLIAERRYYPVEDTSTTEASIYSHLWYDIYITLGESPTPGHYKVHLYYKPGIGLIWFSAGLIALSGVIGILPRRRYGKR